MVFSHHVPNQKTVIMEYKIEKNIVMPLKSNGGYKASLIREVLAKLKIAESFVIPNSDYIHFGNAKKFVNTNRKFTARAISKTHKRIWRIK